MTLSSTQKTVLLALTAVVLLSLTVAESVNEYASYMSRNEVMKQGVAASPTPISPGEASVSAQVKVVYSIR